MNKKRKKKSARQDKHWNSLEDYQSAGICSLFTFFLVWRGLPLNVHIVSEYIPLPERALTLIARLAELREGQHSGFDILDSILTGDGFGFWFTVLFWTLSLAWAVLVIAIAPFQFLNPFEKGLNPFSARFNLACLMIHSVGVALLPFAFPQMFAALGVIIVVGIILFPFRLLLGWEGSSTDSGSSLGSVGANPGPPGGPTSNSVGSAVDPLRASGP